MNKLYTQLSNSERNFIQLALSQQLKPTQIARELNRSCSTITRELKRNGWTPPPKVKSRGRPSLSGGYCAQNAHQRALQGRQKPRVGKRLVPGNFLWTKMLEYLKIGYSPEQLSATLKKLYPEDSNLQLSHETIYTAIYAMPRGELRKEVIGWLRQGHTKRRPRSQGVDRRGQIPDMVSIHQRPAEVEERIIPGHWEGDLIKGAYNRSSIGTLVERTTLFTVLAKMPDAKAVSAVDGFSHVLNRIEAQRRLSVTYDRGREMSEHQRLTEQTGVKVYFADPHSPWQRGINENTNGLLRQYFPKGTDLSHFTQEQLDAIAYSLNTRPRKSLGFKCPLEMMMPESFDFHQHHASLFAVTP